MSQTLPQALAPDQYLLTMKPYNPPQKLDIEVYKTGKSIRMVTPVGRFSFCHLEKPAPKTDKGDPKFTVNIVCGPDSCVELWTAVIKLADAHWNVQGHTLQVGDDGTVKLRNPQTGMLLHTPIKSGDFFYAKNPATYGLYKGMFFVNPSTTPDKPPVYLDARETPLAASAFYSGCYGRAFIEIATIKEMTGYTKGLTAYLRSVSFVRHGDKLQDFDVAGAAREAYASAPLPPDAMPASFAAPGGAPPGAAPGPSVGPMASGVATPPGFAAPPSGTAPWTPPGALPR